MIEERKKIRLRTIKKEEEKGAHCPAPIVTKGKKEGRVSKPRERLTA